MTPEPIEYPKMAHPYHGIGDRFVAKVVAEGGTHDVRATEGKLSARLTEYVFYLTEQQAHPGEALLVMDIHEAIRVLRAAGL